MPQRHQMTSATTHLTPLALGFHSCSRGININNKYMYERHDQIIATVHEVLTHCKQALFTGRRLNRKINIKTSTARIAI